MSKSRVLVALFVLLAGSDGCSSVAPSNAAIVPPSAPAPVPLVLVVNPGSRKATAQPGAAAPSDNATITLTGDGATGARWTAAKRQPWTTLTTAGGNGSGSVSWTRSMIGLAPGVYVDTITITVPGATGSPAVVLDSLVVSTTPVPLVLVVSPHSRSATTVQGATAPDDNAAITLTGDNAATTAWFASGAGGWTTFATASGSGSGSVSWHRNSTGLAVGSYVDTLTITATGASGSPASVIDTLTVLPVPVSLTLALSPTSRSVTVTQGTTAAGSSAAVILAGDNSATTAWTATKRKAWTALTTAAGTGSGTVAWSRNTAALTVGTYVDTIAVTAAASGSPAMVIDTIKVVPAPVTLTLAVSPASRSVMVTQGGSAAGSSAAVTLAGDNAATAAWTAIKRKTWTTLTTASGTGSGTVAWSRNTVALAAGTYVDTISVVAAGASGSPATVIDTVVVAAAGGGPTPDLGALADMHGKQVFLTTDLWNQPVDTAQVDPNSLAILSQIGLGVNLHPDFGANWNGGPFGIPYIVVPDNTPRYTVPFQYASQSDPGPYPIPANPPIEDGGDPSSDSHLIVITQHEWKLYEMYYVQPQGTGWTAGSGAIFDLTTNTQRPAGWTSADAAGLPIFPGLVRYDEVYLRGAITHALRFTVQHTQAAYVAPASHMASSSTNPLNPPMGMRVRLKASFDISGYPAPCQVILRALQKYGMIVADNGSNFFVSGTADARWDDDVNNLLKQVHVSDFEVIKMTGVVTQ